MIRKPENSRNLLFFGHFFGWTYRLENTEKKLSEQLDKEEFQDAWKSRSFTQSLEFDLYVNFKSGVSLILMRVWPCKDVC